MEALLAAAKLKEGDEKELLCAQAEKLFQRAQAAIVEEEEGECDESVEFEAEEEEEEGDEECAWCPGSPTGRQGSDLMARKAARQAEREARERQLQQGMPEEKVCRSTLSVHEHGLAAVVRPSVCPL